jgi:UDP-N-acetylmuramate dehydrogenase
MIPPDAREALARTLGDRVTFDAPMARHTSLRIGGPADALARPADRGELAAVLGLCAKYGLPHQVAGSGFNTLVRDGGLEGITLQLSKLRGLEERPGPALRAEAGVSHSQLTRLCVQRGFSGLEFGAGIPGTLGGWLAMNAGIPMREVESAVSELEVISPTGCKRRHLRRQGLNFVYRALHGLAPGSVIVSVLLSVALSTSADVKAEVDGLLDRRARTQPLNVPSCGSVFKNPKGDHAGRLIEAAGLKGFTIGGAQISPVHANFIANVGGATAADVLALVDHARRTVQQHTGIRLVPEVRVIGRNA